jgi:hypothetical protein
MSDQDSTRPSATPEWRDQDEGADAASDRTYDPSQAEVNRGNRQGLGVGQTELNLQRDPDRMPGDQSGAGDDHARDLSSESGGGPARPKSGSEGAQTSGQTGEGERS